MNEIVYKPIGIIHTPFQNIQNMPIQPVAANGIRGTVKIFSDYTAGLKDINGFSHIILVYHFHLSNGYRLEIKPFLDDDTHGVFATRAPNRPNQIGLSVVKLVNLEDDIIHIENVDIVNGTPLLDIKPFVPDFNAAKDVKIGWLLKSKNDFLIKKSDGRFDVDL